MCAKLKGPLLSPHGLVTQRSVLNTYMAKHDLWADRNHQQCVPVILQLLTILIHNELAQNSVGIEGRSSRKQFANLTNCDGAVKKVLDFV